MDRGHLQLLLRMSFGLLICILVWFSLRTAEPQANESPTSAAAPADTPVDPTASSTAEGATAEPRPAAPALPADDTARPQESAHLVKKEQKMEVATFGGGCFWCVEAVLQRVEGVEKVASGYAGGHIKSPTYEQVCTGRTGHAEVVQVTFDPAKVSYLKLLEIFLKTHDPTTLNRQGHDVGTQYRSIILTHNDEQARQAKEVIAKLDAAHIFSDPIVTHVEPLTEFYPAEEDHQNYYNRNPTNRYCQVVVRSKVEKLEKFFRDMMKPEAK
ncbi:MAG: peptide-methionine (S)-S-oxide reductase MsrA [Aureliella sp.]